jgi:hypothetical protein
MYFIFSSSDAVSPIFPLATSKIADVPVNDQNLIFINTIKKAWEVPAGEVDTMTSLREKACLKEFISTLIPTIIIKQRLFSLAVSSLYVSLNVLRIRLIDPGTWSPFPQNVYTKRSRVRVP